MVISVRPSENGRERINGAKMTPSHVDRKIRDARRFIGRIKRTASDGFLTYSTALENDFYIEGRSEFFIRLFTLKSLQTFFKN